MVSINYSIHTMLFFVSQIKVVVFLTHISSLPLTRELAFLLDNVSATTMYSRVHISSDTAIFKILKKPSIVQK